MVLVLYWNTAAMLLYWYLLLAEGQLFMIGIICVGLN